MRFNYKKVSQLFIDSFIFGDSYQSKCKEIGITYNDLKKMSKDEPVPMEVVFRFLPYFQIHDFYKKPEEESTPSISDINTYILFDEPDRERKIIVRKPKDKGKAKPAPKEPKT